MQSFQPLSILEQKFRIPEQRVKLAERNHLLYKLMSNRHVALTTVVSPAGFGKSTLMSQYVKQLEQDENNKVAWISLDASDNEANQFFSLLCHALLYIKVADKSLINRVNNSSTKTDLINSCQDILNIIGTSDQQIYLLFDDFHFISEPTVLGFINRLIYYRPEQLHLIITSRLQPSLEINSLYVKGLLFSLNAQELKFSLADTQILEFLYKSRYSTSLI